MTIDALVRAYELSELTAAGFGSKTFIYSEIEAGRLRATKRGRRTIIFQDDLEAWRRSFPQMKPKNAAA